jgi:hypothetical protein
MRLRAVTGSVVVVLTLATGAGAGRSLSAMTLQFGDLPTGYTQSKSSACPASCVKKVQGKVPVGYVSGWERDYDAGLKQIVSSVSQYKSSGAAGASVRRSWASAERQHCNRVSMVEKIGSAARLYLCKRSGVSVYVVSWSSGKFKATILLAGYVVGGDVAAGLAVKQQARMKS